jgi:aquaporin NIP
MALATGHLGIAAAFGLVILVMTATFGPISGAHFDPAVTVAFALIRHFPWREVPAYVAGQLLGATPGAAPILAVPNTPFRSRFHNRESDGGNV